MRDAYDLVCLSHLRWDFVFQRPQHLLRRAARERRVFFFEEPRYAAGAPRLDESDRAVGPDGARVHVAVPILPEGMSEAERDAAARELLDGMLGARSADDYVLWYYTPMALAFTRHLRPLSIVYDCMDELSAFRGAPSGLPAREAELFRRASVVFTGGQSLYEAKRRLHPNIHPFPSSVDKDHFAAARRGGPDPADQASIPGPRVGYFGVIDERMDMDLLVGVADARPDLSLVMLGPVVKIDETSLPRRPNIHWLGSKAYADLPAYIAGWDVAMLPFARNESTRFISPTKTPEYLAAGRPVVSTSIRDVVRPYGEEGLAHIADTPGEFVAAIDAALAEDPIDRDNKALAALARMSWDETWSRMSQLIDAAVAARATLTTLAERAAAPTSASAAGAEECSIT